MKKKDTALIAIACAIAAGTIVRGTGKHNTIDITKFEFKKHGSSPIASTSTSTHTAPVVGLSKPIAPWEYHKPLNTDEKREFEIVEAQVQKYLTWGKMDQDTVPLFRQTLFKLGDRAIANLARDLSNVTKEDIKDKADAEAIVQKIDALAYFANSQNPLAADSAATLATRPVTWNDAGDLLKPVEANITFEMFDIFARFRPNEAAQFINSIDKKHRTAYFTHYAYGRKLAGKTLEDIDIELRAVFGSPELALK